VKLEYSILLALCLCLFASTAQAVFELDTAGPRSRAMGMAGAALNDDGWAILRNPALAASSTSAAAFSWSQEFGLPELSREALSVRHAIQSQPFGLRASTFGTKLYRESEFGIIAARSLRPEFSVGLELTACNLNIDKYSSANALAATIGVVVAPLPGLNVAGLWKNLNRPRLSGYRDKLGESLTVGAAADVYSSGTIALDIVQEQYYSAEIRLGAEARLLKNLRLRVGMRAEPVRPSAGVEVSFQRWSFHYAVDVHPDLGISNAVGLAAQLGK
jgi:hypothetical protein